MPCAEPPTSYLGVYPGTYRLMPTTGVNAGASWLGSKYVLCTPCLSLGPMQCEIIGSSHDITLHKLVRQSDSGQKWCDRGFFLLADGTSDSIGKRWEYQMDVVMMTCADQIADYGCHNSHKS